MARRRFGPRRAKRSVGWIDGFNTYPENGASIGRLITLANIGGQHWGAAIALVVQADLQLHGGEDAVLTRCRGSILAIAGRRDAGAGFGVFGFQMRVVVATSDTTSAAGITPFDYTTSIGMGIDNIMWMHDIVVSSVAPGATGSGLDATGNLTSPWLEIDVKAKRRVDAHRLVVLWFQTRLPAGTTAADFQCLGGLRMLMMRPK